MVPTADRNAALADFERLLKEAGQRRTTPPDKHHELFPDGDDCWSISGGYLDASTVETIRALLAPDD